MSGDQDDGARGGPRGRDATDRAARLAAALRANLGLRRAQARARAEAVLDLRPAPDAPEED